MTIKATVLAFSLFLSLSATAQPLNQKKEFTRADTLRGSITAGRSWWDVMHYAISVKPDFNSRSITGSVLMRYKTLGDCKSGPCEQMQIDLQAPLTVDSIIYDGQLPLTHKQEGNVVFVQVPAYRNAEVHQLLISYKGVPRPAIRPPWDGGWIWSKDKQGRPWMTVACQGLGASVWFPCKDHQSDEPDEGASLSITVPDTLRAVGNGRLQSEVHKSDGTDVYTWAVSNPINNYNIIPYIGKYVHFSEVYEGEKGKLDCDYWVLDYNLEKAKEQFRQVPPMLKCFESWFGPYPFYEDGYKLVEAPHLGMEHQSAVAYGNDYVNGYRGMDLSASAAGWGKKFDFIIIHESGHEWFGNNITTKDLADMWVHEGFTNYSETIYLDCQFGKTAGDDYIEGIRRNIQNDVPVQGPYGVNQEGSGDMYFKGSNMLHTIRQLIGNDEKFRSILRGLNKTFYHKTVTTREVEAYISRESGIDLSKVFDQYLRTIQVPLLEYRIEGNQLSYRWTDVVPGFNMPVKVKTDKEIWLKPTEKWQSMTMAKTDSLIVDRRFYVKSKKL